MCWQTWEDSELDCISEEQRQLRREIREYYREMFTPFALAALCLLALEILLSGTLFRRLP